MKKKLVFLSIFAILLVLFVKSEFEDLAPLKVQDSLSFEIEDEGPIKAPVPNKLENKLKPANKKTLEAEKLSELKKEVSLKQKEAAPKYDDSSVHYQSENGDMIITSVSVVDNMVIAHGDLIVGEVEDMEELMERSQKGEPIILPFPKLWDDGVIPYTIADLPNIEEVKVAIETINNTTTVKWVPRDGQEDFVHFKAGPLNCYSSLGRIGGKQFISLSEKCTRSSVAHEMLHAMGLLHEQNREDRDKYIQILWENIDKKNHLQFKKIKYKHLVLEQHDFDFKSIMLYRQNSFSKYPEDFSIIKTDGDTYYPGDELSPLDLKKIKSLYPPK